MAADHSIGTPEQLRDPDYTPPLATALPLGIQHVLAMFVSNITPDDPSHVIGGNERVVRPRN